MSASSLLNTKTAQYAAVAAVAAVALYFIGRKLVNAAPEALAAVGTAVNPVDPRNVFYTGTNAVGGAISGQGSDWSLGSAIYDWTHPAYDPNAPASAKSDDSSWWENLKGKIGL